MKAWPLEENDAGQKDTNLAFR